MEYFRLITDSGDNKKGTCFGVSLFLSLINSYNSCLRLISFLIFGESTIFFNSNVLSFMNDIANHKEKNRH